MMGSMGEVVGEKITRAVERATQMRLPIIIFHMLWWSQNAGRNRISDADGQKHPQHQKRHDEAGLLYITVLTDPTTGGVTASFAMLGDVILAEPGALIGFADRELLNRRSGRSYQKDFREQ